MEKRGSTASRRVFIENAADDLAYCTYQNVWAKKVRYDVLPVLYGNSELGFLYENICSDGTPFYWGSYEEDSPLEGLYRYGRRCYFKWIPTISATITLENGKTESYQWAPRKLLGDYDQYVWLWNGLNVSPLYGYYIGDGGASYTQRVFDETEGLLETEIQPSRLELTISASGKAEVLQGLGDYQNCTVDFTYSEPLYSEGTSTYGEYPAVVEQNIPAMKIGCLYYRLKCGNRYADFYRKMHPESDWPDNVWKYSSDAFLPLKLHNLFPFHASKYNYGITGSDSLEIGDSGFRKTWGGYYRSDKEASDAVWEGRTVKIFLSGKVVFKWQPWTPGRGSLTIFEILGECISTWSTEPVSWNYQKTKSLFNISFVSNLGFTSTQSAILQEAERTRLSNGILENFVQEEATPQRSESPLYDSRSVCWIGLYHISLCPIEIKGSHSLARYPCWLKLSENPTVTLKYRFVEFPDLEIPESVFAKVLLDTPAGLRIYGTRLVPDCLIAKNTIYAGWDISELLQQSVTMTNPETDETQSVTWNQLRNGTTTLTYWNTARPKGWYVTYTDDSGTWIRNVSVSATLNAPYTVMQDLLPDQTTNVRNLLNNDYLKPRGYWYYQDSDPRLIQHSTCGSVSFSTGQYNHSMTVSIFRDTSDNIRLGIADVPKISWWEWDQTDATITFIPETFDAEDLTLEFLEFGQSMEQADVWIGAANVWEEGE